MAKRRLIIDCDPGHDDMSAIALAAGSGAFEIVAITAVSGNAPVDQTSKNALSIAAALGLDCPVYAGAQRALVHAHDYPSSFHGVTGLDSAGEPLPAHGRDLAEGHAALAIIRLVKENPGELTLAVVGPMTNVALALKLTPEIAPLIKDLVFMGGGITQGNATAQAEFNIFADPEAAHIVISAGIPTFMFGLNVTDFAYLGMDDLARIRAAAPDYNPISDILQYYTDRSGDIKAGRVPGPAMHDACPIAWMIDPSLFTLKPMPLAVCIERGDFYGATYADRRSWGDAPWPTINVAVELDQPRFAALLADNLIKAVKKIGSQASASAAQ